MRAAPLSEATTLKTAIEFANAAVIVLNRAGAQPSSGNRMEIEHFLALKP